MLPFKKIISLNQASKISGYTQDYLSFLIRKGEIKGIKKGRTWLTTEEEVKDYIFRRKISKKNLAIRDFFSPTRSKNIFIATIVFFVFGAFFLYIFNKNENNPRSEIRSAVTSDGESLDLSN